MNFLESLSKPALIALTITGMLIWATAAISLTLAG